jgi:penicillin amidase
MTIMNRLLGTVLRGGLTWLSRRRLPQIDGTVRLTGLNATVEVLRDRWGVPHIYAENIPDLFYGQGYVQAQDRLFQMEINRRTAQGTLSEIFGKLALDTDRTTRTFGFNRLGVRDWQNAPQEMREVVLAYTAGVNAYLTHATAELPVEFRYLNYRPAPWKPEDSTAFARVMMWQLSHAWYGEVVRAQLIEAVGAEHEAELEMHYSPENPVVLPQGIEFNRIDTKGHLAKAEGPFLHASMGSNSWVIAGAKMAGGQPFLCNDMHLALGQPGIWYENHLVGGGLNVYGVSLPGGPCVMVGHNERIAWGMTLAFTDCDDLFVEEFDPADQGRYHFRQDWREATLIQEAIPVKGRSEPHMETVVVTHHGPIVGDVIGVPEKSLALQSMALQPSPSLLAWYRLDRAANWDEFIEAMRLIEAPQLNVSYADVDGNIGYWLTGKVPMRASGDGSVPAPGWSGDYEWIGEVPFEEMPHALNPENGFVVHTNNKIIPDDYPYFLGNFWMNGYRARRIEQVLQGKPLLGSDDFRQLHLDFTCLPGQELVARLQGLPEQDADVRSALQMLRTWSGQLTKDSDAACVYEVFRYTLARNLVRPGLGEELAERWMGRGFHPLLMSTSEFYGHDILSVMRMLDNPNSWWIEKAGGKEKVLLDSLKQTMSWLRQELGDDMTKWQWGKLHKAIFPHSLGLKKPLDQVFNRGGYPIGGDTDTPCQTAYKTEEPYDNNAWAPSFRQIIDMGDLSHSLAIAPPGQSGRLGSPHYDDLIYPWLEGEYHPMLWLKEDIQQQAEGKLTLLPSD